MSTNKKAPPGKGRAITKGKTMKHFIRTIIAKLQGDVKPQMQPARDAVLWNVSSGWRVVA